ncbi:MAG: carbohydrate-binding protein [Planctomycetota bacterium]|nr:carbohydrate-binding protein [Planctomycetota bacterium]
MKSQLVLFLLFSLAATATRSDDNEKSLVHKNISYGPYKSNVLDIWIAKGDSPRPLHVYIHGGGWIGGDKYRKGDPQKFWLAKGISYAAINYRHTPEASLPAPVHDAARAIQFLRSKAKEWNIDRNRICLSGGSAGACTSMWILCHDDLADPKSKDPVLRESTRVSGAAVSGGQTAIDPYQIKRWLGPMVLEHRMINMAVGEPTIGEALKNYEKHKSLYTEFSAFNHVSKDDPPLFMKYGGDMTLPSKNPGHGIHHPVFGIKMKEKADQAGMECHLWIGNGKVSKSTQYQTSNEFIEQVLLGPSEKKVSTQPFRGKIHSIPGTIEAEHWDLGPAGVAYADQDQANQGEDYREKTEVDIEKRPDASNGYGIGWTRESEWLIYTVEVKASGTFRIEMPVASNKAGGLFHIEMNGKDVSGPIKIPDTGSWQKLMQLQHKGVKLQKGIYRMKVVMDKNGVSGSVGDIDYFKFVSEKE